MNTIAGAITPNTMLDHVDAERVQLLQQFFIPDIQGTGAFVQALKVVDMHNAFPCVIVCSRILVEYCTWEVRHWLPIRTVQSITTPLNAVGIPPAADVLVLPTSRLAQWQQVVSNISFRAVIIKDPKHADVVAVGIRTSH